MNKKNIYIKKEVSMKKVAQIYTPIIRDVVSSLKKYSSKIYSAYLYGSVATGKAQSPTSDLDVLIVLHRKPSKNFKIELEELEICLSQRYKEKFREIGFAITYKNEVLRGSESYGWRFFISMLSIRLFGKKLYSEVLNYKPTKRLARGLNLDLINGIEDAKKEIQSASDSIALLRTQSVMKKLIRTSFSIVMEEENHWTTDLQEMVTIFIKYYPEKKKELNEVLQLSKNNSLNREYALSILDAYGNWLTLEYFRYIGENQS